jgi:hypothetical protein
MVHSDVSPANPEFAVAAYLDVIPPNDFSKLGCTLLVKA